MLRRAQLHILYLNIKYSFSLFEYTLEFGARRGRQGGRKILGGDKFFCMAKKKSRHMRKTYTKFASPACHPMVGKNTETHNSMILKYNNEMNLWWMEWLMVCGGAALHYHPPWWDFEARFGDVKWLEVALTLGWFFSTHFWWWSGNSSSVTRLLNMLLLLLNSVLLG